MNPREADAIRHQMEREEKLAQIYDREILPLWSHPFGKILLPHIQIPERATILDVACGTGYPTLDLVSSLGPKSRIVALDASHEMLRIAREKAGDLSGKRIFFKHGKIEELNFAPETFDLVFSNCGILDFQDRKQGLEEMTRVAKKGASVLGSFHLQNTFQEFFDIYREVLQRFELYRVLDTLEQYIEDMPSAQDALALFTNAGLSDVIVERNEFILLFPSGREFFFSPLIEYAHLQDWKDVISHTEMVPIEMVQRVFWHIKNAIDLYFSKTPFAVTVHAAYIRGIKP